MWVEVQVGGGGQGALWCGAGRLLRADEVVVVVVMVEVVVAVSVGGGVPQGQDVSPTGWKGRLGGGQVGTGTPQCGDFPWQRGKNHRVSVEQGGGCSLEDKLGALNTVILITLRRHNNNNNNTCHCQLALWK